MKTHFFSFFMLLFAASMSWAATITAPDKIPDYYAEVDGKSGKDLWNAISSITNRGFKSIGYNGLYSAYLKTDVYPSDSIGKAGKIWDMYGECAFSQNNTCGNYDGVCDCYNREHSIPQSWWGGGTSGIGNDIFHVLPTDGKINGVRSNYEYGEVNGGTDWRGNKYGAAGSWSTDRKTIATEEDESVKGSGNVFEPKKQYKGDWARGIMGTIVKWQQSNITSGNNFFSGTYTASGYFGLTKKAVVLLMKWHREDPVSRKEIDRNNGIQSTQGNRNPFIDYPYLAEYIWGERAGEPVDISQLMPSTDPDFIPGISDGWHVAEVPPIPAAMYGITWYANGEVLRVDSICEECHITVLPSTPLSCSLESNVFMGWTPVAISSFSDDAPAALYTKAKDFPQVMADMTYYAVFAKATIHEGAVAATYTYDADQTPGWTNTAQYKSGYWLLDQGKVLTSPEVDLSGLASIHINMRTYGGTQYEMLDISAGGKPIAQIEATKGSTMTEYTWTNTQSLSGKSPITFSTNYGDKKGIGFSSVTINATGAGETYSRYITTCQEASELVDEFTTKAPARKILIGGQIYILMDETLFTITGQRVR